MYLTEGLLIASVRCSLASTYEGGMGNGGRWGGDGEGGYGCATTEAEGMTCV